MALNDLRPGHKGLLCQAELNVRRAIEALHVNNKEQCYMSLAIAAGQLEKVLAVIEDPKNKPRNESPNGPLPVREKRVH